MWDVYHLVVGRILFRAGYHSNMVRGKSDSDLYYQPKGRTTHFNVMYKDAALANRVLARDLVGCRASEIEWVWIVEAKRKATTEEIRLLCSGKWKGI